MVSSPYDRIEFPALTDMKILRFLLQLLTVEGHRDMLLLQVKPTHHSKNPAKLRMFFHTLLDLILGSRVKLNDLVEGNVLFEFVLFEVELAIELL
jgi:hypothetical protein